MSASTRHNVARLAGRSYQSLTYSQLSRTTAIIPPHPSKFSTPQARALSHSTKFWYPRKDSMDKDSINSEATEYSKSATDDEGARHEDAAFNPDVTDPQEQMDLAEKGRGDKNNPLEVSPANPEVSKARGEAEGGAESSSSSSGSTSGRERSSGGSAPAKGKTTR